jgi:hypothetical protein
MFSSCLLLVHLFIAVFIFVTPLHGQTTTTMEDCSIPVTQSFSNLSLSTINSLLRAHNNARRIVTPRPSNMKMVTWNDLLARHGHNFITNCANPFMQHSSSNSRRNVGGFAYVGENLAGSDSPTMTESDFSFFAQMWLDEKDFYTWAAAPCGSSDICGTCVPGKMCGHYTQMVWNNPNSPTTQIGCAYSNACGDARYICLYGNGGNVYGSSPWIAASDPNGPLPACVSATPHTISGSSSTSGAPSPTNSGGITNSPNNNNNNNNNPAPANSDGGSASGIGGGAIAGIVIGAVVGVVLIVGALLLMKRRQARIAADNAGEGVSQNFLFAQTYANAEGQGAVGAAGGSELLELGGKKNQSASKLML